MERNSKPTSAATSPTTSRNPSPTKTLRRESSTEPPKAESPLRGRISRESGRFLKLLTSSLFQDAPPGDGGSPVLVEEHPTEPNAARSDKTRTPRSERRLSAALGIGKTQTAPKPKRLKKALLSFVLLMHNERARTLPQQNLPSLPELRAQIGQEIQRLQLKVDRLKRQQAEYEQPSPLRRDSPFTSVIEALLLPVVERHVLEQCVQAIHASPDPWPTQAGGRKLDFKQLAPEQVGILCATIASQAIVAQRLLQHLPEGFADLGAALLEQMNQAFPEDTEANVRVIAGGLVLRSLMAPFNAMAAAALGAKPIAGEKSGKSKAVDLSGLSPYINFCNEVLASFVNGSALSGLELMPEELQKAIAAAGEALVADMQRVVAPAAL